MTSLSASVGRNGANRTPDARLVQRLLNDARARSKQPLLAVDGIVGPKTIGAIEQYQKANALIADGRADVSGPTIKRLMRDHLATLSGGLIPGALAVPTQAQPPTAIAMNDALDAYWQALKK